jgi:hypothetical protein
VAAAREFPSSTEILTYDLLRFLKIVSGDFDHKLLPADFVPDRFPAIDSRCSK